MTPPLSDHFNGKTFQLTGEGRDEPVQALAEARRTACLSEREFMVLRPG